MAGLEHRGIPGLFWVNTALSVGLDHPMLPAYVAELLAREVDDNHENLSGDLARITETAGEILTHESMLEAWEQSTARQRILAAMVALGHLTIEQAREVE